MPRKRQPLVINGESVDLTAPGLKLVTRRNGEVHQYWTADNTEAGQRAVAAGYPTRTVRLHHDLTTRAGIDALARHCHQLQLAALDWLGEPGGAQRPSYIGTVRSLIACYQCDSESPYRGLRPNTRRCYDDWCRTLDRAFGQKRIDHLSGRDLRNWFNTIMAPATPQGPPRVRLARGCVRQMMPILLSYGAELGLPNCLALKQVLDEMTLRVPDETRRLWRASRPGKVAMSYDHAAAIVRAGLAMGTRRHRSVALGVAAQFEFTLRQIDTIGAWEDIRGQALPPSAIVRHGKVWRGGLRYEDIVDGALALVTSKTGTDAPFDATAYPLFVEALAGVPAADRHGPLVVNESGLPLFRRYYIALYEEVAKAAGVPAAVWNMRARHGGVTEAHDAGADLVDVSQHAQHSNINTTVRHYIVPTIETTRRVAGKRVAHRKKIKGAG